MKGDEKESMSYINQKGIIQAEKIISELIQYGYDKNDILCIGYHGDFSPSLPQNNKCYAVVVPTIEQLVCKDTLFSSKNITVYSAFSVQDWYSLDRHLWCLKHQDIVELFLKNLDHIAKGELKRRLQSERVIELPIVREFYINLAAIHYLQQERSLMWCDKTLFFNKLSHGEKDALQYLAIEIGGEGIVSISKLIEKYPLSRPVWTSLFRKIEEFKIGTVTVKGVKGTSINITHPQLRHDMDNHEI